MCCYIYVLKYKITRFKHTIPISLVPVVVESTLLAEHVIVIEFFSFH